MSTESQNIWYFAYGSNIKAERFFYYILGGTLGSRTYPGCSMNKAVPETSRRAQINLKIVFNRFAYLTTRPGITFGRIYRITKEQFYHLYLQENNIERNELSLEEQVKQVATDAKTPYSKFLVLGTYQNEEVLTFTSPDSVPHRSGYDDYIDLIQAALYKIYDPYMVKKACERYQESKMKQSLGTYAHIGVEGLSLKGTSYSPVQLGARIAHLNKEARNNPIIDLKYEMKTFEV